jgi:hypothetical protein
MWGYPEFYIPVPGGYGTETRTPLHTPAFGSAMRVSYPAVARPKEA